MTRIDVPQGFASVTADTVTVAGIAWAQHTGIAKVEIRVDGGPWKATTLSDEVSLDTWRMWHAELALPHGRPLRRGPRDRQERIRPDRPARRPDPRRRLGLAGLCASPLPNGCEPCSAGLRTLV